MWATTKEEKNRSLKYGISAAFIDEKVKKRGKNGSKDNRG